MTPRQILKKKTCFKWANNWRSILRSKINSSNQPRSMQTLNHQDWCQENYSCRQFPETLHTQQHPTRSTNYILIISFHRYPANLEYYWKIILCNICSTTQTSITVSKEDKWSCELTTNHWSKSVQALQKIRTQLQQILDQGDILAYKPEIEYKKGSLNLMTDSLSRIRTDDHHTPA